MQFLLYLLIGLIAGVCGGFFGLGGGIVLVPMLIWVARLNQHTAQGMSLVALLLPVGFLAAMTYYRANPFPIKPALIMALGLFLGAWLGAIGANHVSGRSLRIAFGVLTIAAGLKLVLGK